MELEPGFTPKTSIEFVLWEKILNLEAELHHARGLRMPSLSSELEMPYPAPHRIQLERSFELLGRIDERGRIGVRVKSFGEDAYQVTHYLNEPISNKYDIIRYMNKLLFDHAQELAMFIKSSLGVKP